MKFSQALAINTDAIRVRSFTFNGQSLKAKIPLASEMELMASRVDNADWKPVYEKLAQPLIERSGIESSTVIEILDDDIRVDGKSIKDLAKATAKTNTRIVEMFKLLIPVNGEDMSALEYSDIEAEFPLSIQLELSKRIAEVISPGYEETRKN